MLGIIPYAYLLMQQNAYLHHNLICLLCDLSVVGCLMIVLMIRRLVVMEIGDQDCYPRPTPRRTQWRRYVLSHLLSMMY